MIAWEEVHQAVNVTAERRVTEIAQMGGAHLLLAMLFAIVRTLGALIGPDKAQFYVTQALIELNTPTPPEPPPADNATSNVHAHPLRRSTDRPPTPPEAA